MEPIEPKSSLPQRQKAEPQIKNTSQSPPHFLPQSEEGKKLESCPKGEEEGEENAFKSTDNATSGNELGGEVFEFGSKYVESSEAEESSYSALVEIQPPPQVYPPLHLEFAPCLLSTGGGT